MADNPYPLNFYFQLSFEGEDAAFKEVSGLSMEMAVEEVACGGENRFKYRLPTISSSQNLVLKRAMVPKGSKLAGWVKATLGQGLSSNIKTQDVDVSLLNAKGQLLTKWKFHNAYPIKYSFTDLKSQESEIMIETIELAYTYFNITVQ